MRNPIDALRERFGHKPEDVAPVEFTGAAPPDPLTPGELAERAAEAMHNCSEPTVEPSASYVFAEELGAEPVPVPPLLVDSGLNLENPGLDPSPQNTEELTDGDALLQSIATEFILVCSSPDCDGTCVHNSTPDGSWAKSFQATTEEGLARFAEGPQVRCIKCGGWQDRRDCELYAP